MYFVCIIYSCTLLKVVSHYDLGVDHASDGFPKKMFGQGDALVGRALTIFLEFV